MPKWVTFLSVVATLVLGCSSEVETRPGDGSSTGGGGAGGSGQTPCSVETCTLQLGGPGICAGAERACVPLTSTECSAWIGDEQSDDARWLGLVAPFSANLEFIGTTLVRGVQLQHEEFHQVAALGATPYNILICDSQGDVVAAMDHLTQVVEVPAIIGPALSSVLLEVAEQAVEADTMLLSPSSTSPVVTELDDDGKVWRTAASDSNLFRGMVGLTTELETQIRSEQAIASGTPIRVAILHSQAPFPAHTYEAYVDAASINGLTVAQNGANVLAVEIPQPDGSPDYSGAITSIAQFEPHLVVGFGFSGEVVDPIGLGVEAALGGAAPRPYYALTELAFNAARDASSDAALRPRLTGLRPGWHGLLWEAFGNRYRLRFDEEPALAFASNAYDAAMLLAFALAGDEEPTGSSLASRMAQMVSGPIVEGQPGDIEAGLQLTSAGASFDYEGASGPVDFDLATGDVEGWMDVWCFGSAGVETSAPYYDPKLRSVTGQLGCP